MVLLVLAAVWAVALTPMILRKFSERRVLSSVTSFDRRLGRLRSSSVWDDRATGPFLAPLGFSAVAQRVQRDRAARFDQIASDDRLAQRDHLGDGTGPIDDAGSIGAPREPIARLRTVTSPITVTRRRRVLACLVAFTGLAFLFGFVPPLRLLWDLALVGFALLSIYVALLVRFHRLAVERVQKVVALETRRSAATALDHARYSPAQGTVREPVVSGSGWRLTAGSAELIGRHHQEVELV
ncbi:MAG: hypothetical protein ACRDZ6_10890, partial [Acidimicrobiales bacterium]